MRSLIGVDRGTAEINTSEEISFRATVRKYKNDEIVLNGDSKIIVEFEGDKYVIGEKGKTSTEMFKSKSKETKLLILTAIALGYPNQFIQTNLITGLPIQRYAEDKEEMKDLFANTRVDITINGEFKTIDIFKVEVFPESAGAFFTIPEAIDGLIIDIGGLTVDCAWFESNDNDNTQRKLKSYGTYQQGILPLYRQIANRLSTKYSISLDEWDIPRILKMGLTINGKKIKDLEIDQLLLDYVNQIIQGLEFEYPIKSIENIYLCGGGSVLLYDIFKEKINRAILIDDPSFANAIGYKMLGEVLFNEES